MAQPNRHNSAALTERAFRHGREQTTLALLATLILPGLFWAYPAEALEEPEKQSPQPNVVILVADDLGWADVGYRGGGIETPAIDSLAKEGVVMDRFYATPICSPTRAALMTGRDPLKLGIAYDQIHPWYNVGLPPDAYTIADAFREDGYQTGIVGKWHLGHTPGPPTPERPWLRSVSWSPPYQHGLLQTSA